MKSFKFLLLTASAFIFSVASLHAQQTARGKTKGKVVMTGRPGSIYVISLGGGTSMPSSDGKDNAFLSNSTVINADLSIPITRRGWGPNGNWFGVNIGGAYNFGNGTPNFTTPSALTVTGQTSSTVSPRGGEPAPGFRMGAGPQFNFHFGKFVVSPMVLGEYFSMKQKAWMVNQTTHYNGQSYDFSLVTMPEIKTSGFAVTPKIRLNYMLSQYLGFFADASYTMGPKIETQLTRLVPNGPVQTPGNTYNLQQLQTGTYVKGETKSTAYKAIGVNFGVLFNFGRKGWNGKIDDYPQAVKNKTKSNSTNERTAKDDSSGIRKGWNGTVPMTVPNTGVNQPITIVVAGTGNTTADGTPIVNSRTISGYINGLQKPATVTISQTETNDIGTGRTDANGNFEIKVKGDTIHKVYVNGKEFGKIKIITDGSYGVSTSGNPSSKTTSCACGTWSPLINFELYPTGLLGGSFTNKTMACGSTFNLSVGNAVKIATTNFTCTGGCMPYIKATVLHNGVTIPSLTNVNLGTVAEQSIPECGDYQIILKSKCVATPAVICPDSCVLNFHVPCPDTVSNQPNCCEGSKWGAINLVKKNGTAQLLQCGQDIGLIKCNTTSTINASYFCNPQCQSVNAQLVYQIYSNSGVAYGAAQTVSSATNVSITSPNVTGSWYLNITALCGGDTCGVCKINFSTECIQQQLDCCKGGKWLTKYYSITAPLIKTMPIAVDCNGNYEAEVIPDGTITFDADYLCNPALGNCTKQVLVSVKKAGSASVIMQPVSYSMPLNTAGVYTVCYYAVCGKDTCNTCCFTVTVKEKKDCCKGGYWINKSIDWENGIDKTSGDKTLKSASGPIVTLPVNSIDISKCNVSYKLSLGGTYTFNADYHCASKDCAKNVKVKIKGLSTTVLDGLYSAPVTKTITVAGNYMVTYYAYCGQTLCDSCVFAIGIDKNCCLNSKWNSANYQIVNKKADGSWIWEPAILPIGNTIPTLKADLGIDISSLDFTCAKGCTPQYVIRRINQSTGALAEPDETLAPGQTTTSVYAKPYPQLIIITPVCDGQKCTPLMFRVECLHKNCCVQDKIIFSTGMTPSGGVATGAETQWYGAIPLTILSPGTAPLFGTGSGTGGSATILQNLTTIATLPFYTAKRDFTVSKSCAINISGKLGISRWTLNTWTTLFRSFKLFKGTTEVWHHNSITPGSVGSYETNDFNANLTVTPGVYTFVFEYNKAGSANNQWLKNSMFVTGQIEGNILPTSAECCSSNTINTGGQVAQEQASTQTISNPLEENSNCTLTIGQSYQGGKIAYILKHTDAGYNANVCHGLIVSLNELPTVSLGWGCAGMAVGTSSAYGSGKANTLAMAAACPASSIAAYCINLIEGGYNDWHLPSKDELAKVFIAKNSIGGFSTYAWYATSTEYSGFYIFAGGYFHDASTTYLQGTTSKSCCNVFRAVRYF